MFQTTFLEKIDDDFSTKSAQVLNKPHTSTNMPPKIDNEKNPEKRNENSLPSSITCRKRNGKTSKHDNVKRKKTDEALSISQNLPNYNPCNIQLADSNDAYDIPNKRVVPGRRTYAETLEYGKKVVIFGDSHITRTNRKRLTQNMNGKALIKHFSGVTSEELEYYVYPTI